MLLLLFVCRQRKVLEILCHLCLYHSTTCHYINHMFCVYIIIIIFLFFFHTFLCLAFLESSFRNTITNQCLCVCFWVWYDAGIHALICIYGKEPFVVILYPMKFWNPKVLLFVIKHKYYAVSQCLLLCYSNAKKHIARTDSHSCCHCRSDIE